MKNKKEDDYLKFGNEKEVMIIMILLMIVAALGYITQSEIVDIIGCFIVMVTAIIIT